MLAEIIAIGDELTSGQRLDTNSQWLSRELGLLGIPVRYHTTTCDTLEAGVHAFQIAARRAQVVVATGGLGPTADDLTRDVLAELSGKQLVLSEQALEVITSRFLVRHAVMPESNRRQALFPDGSCPIENPDGTAPGIAVSLPASDGWGDGHGCVVYVLPGVPAEMRRMWDETVSIGVKKGKGSKKVLRHRRLKCFGAGESAIEEMLPGLIERGHDPTVGITAHEATITLRISAWADDQDSCMKKIFATENMIREKLGQLVYGEEDDEVEDAAGAALIAASASLATIEAGTAGRVAALFAQAADRRQIGTEPFFRGGLVLPELSLEKPNLIDAAKGVAKSHNASVGMAIGPVRPIGTRQAVDVIVVKDDSVIATEHILGGGGIAMSRAAKSAIDQVRQTLL
ncbi:MAG: damage-inducible protein CinA [Planctomycetaceae bacterium]|nr:damage-inducible protein CinA [Planctomycetaceae bacterium]